MTGTKWARTKMSIEPEALRRLRWSRRYRTWRARILRDEPLCRLCAEAGFTVAAEHIDHIEPAHLAPERFWDHPYFDLLECLKHRRIVVAPEEQRPHLLRDSRMKLTTRKQVRTTVRAHLIACPQPSAAPGDDHIPLTR